MVDVSFRRRSRTHSCQLQAKVELLIENHDSVVFLYRKLLLSFHTAASPYATTGIATGPTGPLLAPIFA